MAKDPSIERPGFDVFGMMLILTFLMTGGACFLLNDELSSNWGYKLFGDQPASQKWHLTEYRDLNRKYEVPYIDVRKVDVDEWKAIPGNSGSFPVKDYEWPAEYKVNEFPIDPGKNTWEKTEPKIKEFDKKSPDAQKWYNQIKALVPNIESEAAPAPKEEPKKDDAAKPDAAAPKADAAPKTDAAPKADVEKAPEKKDADK